MRALIFVLMWIASTLFAPLASAQSPDTTASGPGTAVIVLDGSGSMGGPLEGQKDVKFDMASRALLQLLPTATPQSRTGLVTFGNRRKGDCSDVSVVVEPASGNVEQFRSAFGRIGPTGRGPLVAGLREAAKTIAPDTPGTLIVVHDDVDNCRQDVCAAAAELAKTDARLTVHVISISLDKTTSEKMSCLATVTGGRVFEARDAASVESAMSEALQLAKVLDAAAPAAAVPDIAPAPETAGPPSVRLSAGLSGSGAALSSPILWRILAAGTPEQVVKEATVPVLTSELPAGSYVIEARYGYASARKDIDVAATGQTAVRISLDAANVRISGSAGKAGEPLANPITTVSAIDGTTAPRPLYVGQSGNADLVLPAGTYRVAIADGLAAKKQDITLAAGDTKSIEFPLGTGRLELSAISREGGAPLDGAVFTLSVDDPDAPQGRREVARSIAPRPAYVLPAGTYYVSAKLGAAEIKDRIAIGTGDVVKRAIALNGAWTSLSANLDTALAPASIPVAFRVISKGKDEREIAHANSKTGGTSTDVFLPQGSYRIEASIGRLNVKAQADAEVVAGPKAAFAVRVAASELTLIPSTGTSSGSPAAWDLRDGQGRIIQRSLVSLAQKTLLVAPGRYLVRIEAGGARTEQAVDLKPGERRTLPLGPN